MNVSGIAHFPSDSTRTGSLGRSGSFSGRDCSEALLASVIESTEIGIAVVSDSGTIRYANPSARRLLAMERGMPEGVQFRLRPMVEEIRKTGRAALQRWVVGATVLRVRLRGLGSRDAFFLLELTAMRTVAEQDATEALARSVGLKRDEALMLAMIWRGLNNEEIARKLGVANGTVKSRLYRLYQRLGVKNRIGAALVAAEVLGPR